MMVGNAWNARMKPIDPSVPGGCAKRPKKLGPFTCRIDQLEHQTIDKQENFLTRGYGEDKGRE